MKILYSSEDTKRLDELNKQLSEYDATLISVLTNEINKHEVIYLESHNTFRKYLNDERTIKERFLNDVGRNIILQKIMDHRQITMPIGIEI